MRRDQCDLCGAWRAADLIAPIWDGEGSACVDSLACGERIANPPAPLPCRCGAPAVLPADYDRLMDAEVQFDCADCAAAEAAAEAASLAFAESGGGQEMVNDLRFHECYDE